MYVLTLFYRHGSQVRLEGTNAEQLEDDGIQAEHNGLIWAWRVVNRENGKCVNYWREGENEHDRAYQL